MVKNKKITAVVAGGLAATVLLGASFALFTDREAIEANANTAKFQVLVDRVDVDMNVEQLLPGDKLDLHYTVENDSTVKADIRQTLALRVVDAGSMEHNEKFVGFDLLNAGQSEFDIYLASDVHQDEFGAYVANDGATPLQVKEIVDANTIKYTIDSSTYEVDQITDHDFVILFNKSADNSWKSVCLDAEVVVEAKQTTNNADDWSEVQTIKYTAAQGLNMNVVVSEPDLLHKVEYTHNGSVYTVCPFMEYNMTGSCGRSSGESMDFNVIQLGVEKDFTMTASGELADYVDIQDDIITFKYLDAGSEDKSVSGYIVIECDGLTVNIPCNGYLYAL